MGLMGKEKCRILKRLRAKIAKENNISGFEYKECPYTGPCNGTCPACEDELLRLSREIDAKNFNKYLLKKEYPHRPVDGWEPSRLSIEERYNKAIQSNHNNDTLVLGLVENNMDETGDTFELEGIDVPIDSLSDESIILDGDVVCESDFDFNKPPMMGKVVCDDDYFGIEDGQ